ncbi:protection of telomeres protein 1 isoform X2 [Hyperolius riggenbachi]|uniref:protection of telomeres protein 1 isoform X2 n=1 Tax=Hyperolius riggenbachi TaxID=752182 RepID=UPI0035A26EF3
MSAAAQKYVYTPLDQLKQGSVVNVYGAVTFFIPPFHSKGPDFCSVVTIKDQSNAQLNCRFFSGNQETLPQIAKQGDIVRFHRIKVWDGSKCAFPPCKVFVEDETLEGDLDFISRLQNLIVDILVYDNHVETAKSLKIGNYIVMQNLHAKLHTTSNDDQGQLSYMEFHLHGGTWYGRGITVLPENGSDVQELQKILDVELNKNPPMDSISSSDLNTSAGQKSPPFDALERCQQLSVTVLPAHNEWLTTPLSTVIKSKAPQKYRVRARLRKFQPQHLYQSVKLHCAKCSSLQDIPNEEKIDDIFQGKLNSCLNKSSHNTSWYQSALWRTKHEDRSVIIYFVRKQDMLQNSEDSLIMIEGGTFKEVCKLSGSFHSVIPVTSNQDHLEIQLSAPFLIQGNRWHYGCSKCSRLNSLEALTSLPVDTPWNATEVAKALGIEPLMHVFVMDLTLDDGTGSLNAYLWRHAEQFFQIPAAEIPMENELQERLHNIMATLCPTEKAFSEYPWMDCCIRSYHPLNGSKEEVYYDIFDTQISYRSSACSKD